MKKFFNIAAAAWVAVALATESILLFAGEGSWLMFSVWAFIAFDRVIAAIWG